MRKRRELLSMDLKTASGIAFSRILKDTQRPARTESSLGSFSLVWSADHTQFFILLNILLWKFSHVINSL